MGGIAVTKREKFKMRGAFHGVGFFWFWNLDIYEVTRRRKVSNFQSFNGKTDGLINVSKVTRISQSTSSITTIFVILGLVKKRKWIFVV